MGRQNWTKKLCQATYDAEHSSTTSLRRAYKELAEHYQAFGERIYPNGS